MVGAGGPPRKRLPEVIESDTFDRVRRHPAAWLPAICLALAVGASPAFAREADAPDGRVRRDRRPVLPARRQRWHRRPALRRPRPLRVRHRAAHGPHDAHGAGDPGPVAVQPRLPAQGDPGPRGRPRGGVRPGQPARAADHARRAAAAAGQVLTVEVRYAGRPADASLPRREELARRRPRGRHDERAAHGSVVVPRQRPPAGQGHHGRADHRAEAAQGDLQRLAGRPGGQGRAGHDPLAVQRADGAVPRVLRGRELRRPQGRRWTGGRTSSRCPSRCRTGCGARR